MPKCECGLRHMILGVDKSSGEDHTAIIQASYDGNGVLTVESVKFRPAAKEKK